MNIFLCAFLLSLAQVVWGQSNVKTVEQDLHQVHKTIKETQEAIVQYLHTENRQQQDLAQIEKKIAAYETERAALEMNVNILNTQLQTLQKQSMGLETQYQLEIKEVEKIAFLQMKTYKKAPISTFLSQKKPLWLAELKYYQLLQETQNMAFVETANSLQKLQDAQEALLEKQAELTLMSNKADKVHQKLMSEKEARKAILTHLKQDIHEKSQNLTQLSKNEAALQSILKELSLISDKQSLGIDLSQSVLAKHKSFPVSRALFRLTTNRYFPQTEHPNFIPLTPGTPVQAILSGKVVFSDWLRGVGLLIIVDHGQGYMSLYGNQERLSKTTGDSVAAGEILGYTGQTGGIPEPGLYFEIRKKGQPINPLTWFKS